MTMKSKMELDYKCIMIEFLYFKETINNIKMVTETLRKNLNRF